MSLREYSAVPDQEVNSAKSGSIECSEVPETPALRLHNASKNGPFPPLTLDSCSEAPSVIGQAAARVKLEAPNPGSDATGLIDGDDNYISVDDAIERLGTGRFQLIVLTAAGLCFASDGMQILLLSFLSEVLRLEWSLSDDERSFITSVLFIGAIFGTLTLGPLADRIGRKPVFLLSACIISCFGVIVATVTNYWALLANLFMVGWGVGGLTGTCLILAKHCF